MNRNRNYITRLHWQKAETVIKRIVMTLHGAGVIPENHVKALFRKLPGLRQA